jgi:hypothetical protein
MARCKGCSAEIEWAINVNTGKTSPLILATADEKPNIIMYLAGGEQMYSIATEPDPQLGKPLYVNHFSNCPEGPQFHKTRKEPAHGTTTAT